MQIETVGIAEAFDAAIVQSGSERLPVDQTLTMRTVFLLFIFFAPARAVLLGRSDSGDQEENERESHGARLRNHYAAI